jgi:hypothetical protein
MKKNASTLPQITATIETVTPAMAREWLAEMGVNRNVKEASVAMYASDMANGNWKLSPQGIAFDENGTVFDGQHRLHAVIRSEASVPMLIIRGFPVHQGSMKTMDIVDCGVVRSLADRIKLMGCHSKNPNLVCAVSRQLAKFALGQNSRATSRISLANTMDIIGLWAEEINMVVPVVDSSMFKPIRNAPIAAALVLAAAAAPNKTRDALAQIASGANLDSGSPLLVFRNALISGDAGDRLDRTIFCLSALLCHWHNLAGSQIYKEANKAPAEKFFRDAQKDRLEKLATFFLIKDEPQGKA